MNDKESLHKVIKGAYGVFSVTNFWEHFSAETEITQGNNVADVSKVRLTEGLSYSLDHNSSPRNLLGRGCSAPRLEQFTRLQEV